MKIGPCQIGRSEPVYVIAEIGSNHDGNLDQAKELIRVAADAGADAAKFQLYRSDKLYPGTITPGAIPDWWLPELKQACHEEGVEFICSVFCVETLKAYLAVRPAAVKIASPEATNEELLYEASSLPMIVSTGAMDWRMCDRTNAVLAGFEAEYALLHCVSAYPPSASELNLGVITTMRERYGVPIGFSDHSVDAETPSYAVMAGAAIIEVHITPSQSLPGPDHSFAVESHDFAGYVAEVREAERWRGDGVKRVQPSEDALDRRAA